MSCHCLGVCRLGLGCFHLHGATLECAPLRNLSMEGYRTAAWPPPSTRRSTSSLGESYLAVKLSEHSLVTRFCKDALLCPALYVPAWPHVNDNSLQMVLEPCFRCQQPKSSCKHKLRKLCRQGAAFGWTFLLTCQTTAASEGVHSMHVQHCCTLSAGPCSTIRPTP